MICLGDADRGEPGAYQNRRPGQGRRNVRRTVAKYHRVRFDDLVAYKRKDDEARAKVLDQLTAEAQELGIGY
jgi:uncharacterized protein YbjQ (UPF0145 family)